VIDDFGNVYEISSLHYLFFKATVKGDGSIRYDSDKRKKYRERHRKVKGRWRKSMK